MKLSDLPPDWKNDFLGDYDLNVPIRRYYFAVKTINENPGVNTWLNLSKLSDERMLQACVFLKLKTTGLLPDHVKTRSKVKPLLLAFIHHYDTFAEFDAAKNILEPLIKAFLVSDHVRKHSKLSELLCAILKTCTTNNVTDASRLLKLLNITEELLQNKNGMQELISVIENKGVTCAYDFLIKIHLIIFELNKKNVDASDIQETLDRMSVQSVAFPTEIRAPKAPPNTPNASPNYLRRNGRVSPAMFNSPVPSDTDDDSPTPALTCS